MEDEIKGRLKGVIELLLKHKEEMDRELYGSCHYKMLGIERGDSSMKNLKKWFIMATGPGWRGGPPKSFEERKEMLKGFNEWYENVVSKILPTYHEQEAMDKLYEELVKIKQIGPKIATVYLRDIIYHFNVWPELRDYLYLPIDRHVRNILTDRLGVNKEEVLKEGESYLFPKNKKFQEELSRVHKPRVEFDYLWYIGAKSCSFHLCDFCLLREYCRKMEPLEI